MADKPSYEELEQKVKKLEQAVHERKFVEEDIIEWKNRYESAVMSSGHILYDWDSVTNEVTYGGILENILGYTNDEMSGDLSKWIEIIHSEDRIRFTETIEKLIATRNPISFEYRVRRKDGEFISIEDAGQFIKEKNGKVTRMIGFVKDISGRKRIEEALRKVNKQYQRLLEDLGDNFLIYSHRLDGTFTYASPGIESIFGIPKEEAIGSDWGKIIKWDSRDLELAGENIRNIVSGLEYKRMEMSFRHPDGKQRTVFISPHPTKNSEGSVVAIEGIVEDITARKHTEEKLRNSEGLFQLVTQTAEIGITNTDLISGKVVWDETCYRIHGYKPGTLINLDYYLDKIIHPDEKVRILPDYRSALASNINRYRVEYRIIRPDGSVRWLDEDHAIVRDKNGNAIRTHSAKTDISKRKEAEVALRESEEKYRTLFEDSPISLWEEDFSAAKLFIDSLRDKGINNFRTYFEEHPEDLAHCMAMVKIVDINKTTIDMYQVETKKAFLKGLDLFFTEESYEVFKEEIVSLCEGKTSFEAEAVTQTATGEVKHIYMKCSLASGYEETWSKVLVSISDVTERKRAEEEIRRSKILLESSIESPKDMIILSLDREYRYLYFNIAHAESMRHVYGTRPKIGECIFDHMKNKDDIKKVKEHYDRALSGEGHVAIEEYGEVLLRYYYEIRYNPVYNQRNEIIGVTSFAQNITERKQAEEVLLQKTHDLGERIKELNCLYGISNLVEKPDISLEEIFQGLVDLIPASWQYPEITCSRIILEDKEYKTENFKETNWKQSSEILVHGKRMGVLEVCYLEERPQNDEGPFLKEERDLINAITERLGNIIVRMRSREEKERLEAQLQQANKMEAIAILAGGIAHEFNNTLMGIMGNIELLKMNLSEDEGNDKYLERMKRSGHRMSGLTAQLLAYAEGGKYQPKDLKLDDFVIETLPILQHDLSPEVRVETHLPKDISYIKADNAQMQMVLSAILANSNEAIEDVGLIRIVAENKDIDEGFIKQHAGLTAGINLGLKPGPYVCLTVEDDGEGMDEETKDGIFEPFFTTKFQGRGMGMAAVHGIVRNHDGWISVDSELDKGTVVRIYLPATEIEVEKPRKAKVEVSTGSGTILMIEDEDVVIEVTQAMLEMLGYRVMVAKTGKDAIHIAETFDGQIDLALLDIKLPDIDGRNLYPLIMKARSDLKVVVFSGYSIDGPAREILDAGAQDFIQKPFSIATLSEKLKEVLEGK